MNPGMWEWQLIIRCVSIGFMLGCGWCLFLVHWFGKQR